MIPVKKPRVAGIGLDASQQESIARLCGELRPVGSLAEYEARYSWTETDVVVLVGQSRVSIPHGTHTLTVGPHVAWGYSSGPGISETRCLYANQPNTEREVFPRWVAEPYGELTKALCVHLERSQSPPRVLSSGWGFDDPADATLITTTSGYVVAWRHLRTPGPGIEQGKDMESIVLALPAQADLGAWFRAFLVDLHKTDPDRVPIEPPRMASPSDWYTPQEKQLAHQTAENAREIVRLMIERERLQDELTSESARADTEIRRVLWADGDDLVEAVKVILGDLRLAVRDMDAEVQPGEPKREDLRLTHPKRPNWEAIVEVKGYLKGTKTKDARQIREQRDRYNREKRQLPDLTLWIANPYRSTDPSSRPDPDRNVVEAAENIGAVYVLASDLYLQWVLVKEGSLEASDVVEHLITSNPGRWNVLAPPSEQS